MSAKPGFVMFFSYPTLLSMVVLKLVWELVNITFEFVWDCVLRLFTVSLVRALLHDIRHTDHIFLADMMLGRSGMKSL